MSGSAPGTLLPMRPAAGSNRVSDTEQPGACQFRMGPGSGYLEKCKQIQLPMPSRDEWPEPNSSEEGTEQETLSPVTPAWMAAKYKRAAGNSSSDSAVARRLQAEYDDEVAQKEANEQFTCKICFTDQKLEDGRELDCGHMICAGCFAGYLEVKIREKCVSQQEMCCPMPKCFCPITEHQVMGVLTSALKERFLDTRAELYRPDRPFERHCRCPCGEAMVVETSRAEGMVTCPSCKEQVCFNCQERHEGSSCAAYWKWRKENDAGQQAFEQLMVQEGGKNCPVCAAPCLRAYGCNFMTCQSPACRNGKGTHFCYICGDQLTEAEHYLHFHPDGLFRDFCKNKPRSETDIPEPDFWMQLWRLVESATR